MNNIKDIQVKEFGAMLNEDLGEKINQFKDSLPKGAKIVKISYKMAPAGTDFMCYPNRYALVTYEVQKEEGTRAGF